MRIAKIKKVEGRYKVKCPYCGYDYEIRIVKPVKSCPVCKRYFALEGIDKHDKQFT